MHLLPRHSPDPQFKADDEDEDGWGRSAQRTTASGSRVRQQRDPGRLSLRTPPGDDDLDHPDRVSEIYDGSAHA